MNGPLLLECHIYLTISLFNSLKHHISHDVMTAQTFSMHMNTYSYLLDSFNLACTLVTIWDAAT